MLKKVLGILCVAAGLPLLGFSIYKLVATVLALITQFSLSLLLSLIFPFIAIFAGIFLGISFIRGGLLLFNYNHFSIEDIALQHLTKIYKKEDLSQATTPIPDPSKYLKTKNMDLADIYQQIDSAKFPETHQDLLATIKARVEKA